MMMSDRSFFLLESAEAPITEPVSKLGGQPVWLEEPRWPVSRQHGTPMSFIGQFVVAGGLAYLFMTDATEYVDDAWEWDGGENAVIVQPGGRLPLLPSIGPKATDPRPIDVVVQETGPTVGPDHRLRAAPDDADSRQFFGGDPRWVQSPAVPRGDYHLLVQLDADRIPLPINFGDLGVGYLFLSSDLLEGRFLWQN
jgi:hypothetical protein